MYNTTWSNSHHNHLLNSITVAIAWNCLDFIACHEPATRENSNYPIIGIPMASTLRDYYGLRTTTARRRYDGSHEEGKRRAHQLNTLLSKTEQLRDAMDLNHFVSVSLESMSRRLSGEDQSVPAAIPSLAGLQHPVQDQNHPINIEKELVEVERRLTEINPQNEFLLLLLRRINYIALGLNITKLTPGTNDGDDDSEEPFYRYHRMQIHKKPSASLWIQDLGIVCPGWRKHGSADSEVTKTHVQQHFTKGDTSYPPFISVSDDPARIYTIREFDTADPVRIFIISPSKLRKMGIKHQMSTDQVREVGLDTYSKEHRNGVHYATESQWLVHRWIPKECIVGGLSIRQFQAFCTKKGILEQTSGSCRFLWHGVSKD